MNLERVTTELLLKKLLQSIEACDPDSYEIPKEDSPSSDRIINI